METTRMIQSKADPQVWYEERSTWKGWVILEGLYQLCQGGPFDTEGEAIVSNRKRKEDIQKELDAHEYECGCPARLYPGGYLGGFAAYCYTHQQPIRKKSDERIVCFDI